MKKVVVAKKIGGYVCLRYEEDKYGVHFISEEDNKYEGKRFDLFIWNPCYESPMGGKHNKYNIPEELVMRAFIALYPDMNKYYDVYDRLYNNKKESAQMNTVNNNAIDILAKALREQADMYEKALQQQAEMNKKNVENLIAIITGTDTNNVTEDVTSDDTVNTNFCMPPEDDDSMKDVINYDEDDAVVVDKIEKEDLSYFDNMILNQ